MEGWKGGRVEGWKGGRVEGWMGAVNFGGRLTWRCSPESISQPTAGREIGVHHFYGGAKKFGGEALAPPAGVWTFSYDRGAV
jgi:hypothetical protein